MAEKIKIIEVALIGGDVLVTFFDGRVARLDSDEIHARSIEAPADPTIPD